MCGSSPVLPNSGLSQGFALLSASQTLILIPCLMCKPIPTWQVLFKGSWWHFSCRKLRREDKCGLGMVSSLLFASWAHSWAVQTYSRSHSSSAGLEARAHPSLPRDWNMADCYQAQSEISQVKHTLNSGPSNALAY